jgi:hypothetical protein
MKTKKTNGNSNQDVSTYCFDSFVALLGISHMTENNNNDTKRVKEQVANARQRKDVCYLSVVLVVW